MSDTSPSLDAKVSLRDTLATFGRMRCVIIPFLGAVLLVSRVLGLSAPDSTDVHTLKEAEAAAIHHPHPDYPLEARRQHLSGRGIVVGVVDRRTGKLESLKMEQSTGHALLDDAILRTFHQWSFKPGTISRFHIPVSYTIMNPRDAMDARERIVLYQLDHTLTAKKLRQLAAQYGWLHASIPANNQHFPPELRRFDPCCAWLCPDYIELKFGGAFGEIGFRAFRPGLVGYGTRKLGEGVWYYAQDGRVPAP
jgi:TonB family protein